MVMVSARLTRRDPCLPNIASSSAPVSYGGDAVDLDVEVTGPRRHIHEDASWWILREVPGVDGVDGGEFLDRRAVHVAFEHVLQRRPGRLQAEPVWRSIRASTTSPVAGSNGGNPDT
jgi:hypothetical protein